MEVEHKSFFFFLNSPIKDYGKQFKYYSWGPNLSRNIINVIKIMATQKGIKLLHLEDNCVSLNIKGLAGH